MAKGGAGVVSMLQGGRIFTVREVMECFDVSRPTVYKWLALGLPSYRIGRVIRIVEADLNEWFEAHAR